MAWETLVAMIAEARDIDAQEASKVPQECPNDYTPLREGPNGISYCPWDGWQHPRDA